MKYKILLIVAVCLMMAGCSATKEFSERFWLEKPPYTSELPDNYYQVMLQQDSSADVIPLLSSRPDDEIVNQTESVVVAWGRRKQGSQLWLTQVAFDEENLMAQRKAFFATDEKSHHLFAEDQKLFFEAEIVLSDELLNEAYAGAEVQNIEYLREVYERTKDDLFELTTLSQDLHSCYMMINQVFNTLLHKLDQNQAIAVKLTDPKGLRFDHMNYGGGIVGLQIMDTVVQVRIKVGYKPWGFEQGLEL